MNLYSANDMKDLLTRHDFFFKKNLGQNFLMNRTIAERIARAAREEAGDGKTLAVEIGPGAGSLTLQLSFLFDQVLALEIDPHLIGVLEESLAECNNVTVINQDALTFDYASLCEKYAGHSITVCSNLPYYITSEILMRLLESGLPLKSIVVLIQKEAATRIKSAPGDADYGAITAVVSYYAKAKRLFSVGPGNFFPKPKVDSSVLLLQPYREKPVSVDDESLFFAVIRAAFSQRRKTLYNALCQSFSDRFPKEQLFVLLEKAGIDPRRRGETLTLAEFANIANAMTNATEDL